ncbi:MAG: hypothetical protein ABI586_09530 [Candidatus Nanopelagicales bacterium]
MRWSLKDADDGVAQKLRDYVTQTSLARFSGMEGLHQKTWRMVESEWFEGTYVFTSREARDHFLAGFMPGEAKAPGSLIIGSTPIAYEPFEVVAIAEGDAGFVTGAGPGRA